MKSQPTIGQQQTLAADRWSQTWGHERDRGKMVIGQVTAERKDMKNRDNRTFLAFTCNLLTMCALRFTLKKVSFRHPKAHLSPPRSSPFTLRLVSDDRRLWTFLDKNHPSPPFEAADTQHQTAQKSNAQPVERTATTMIFSSLLLIYQNPSLKSEFILLSLQH